LLVTIDLLIDDFLSLALERLGNPWPTRPRTAPFL
jgi:hypothetical protein